MNPRTSAALVALVSMVASGCGGGNVAVPQAATSAVEAGSPSEMAVADGDTEMVWSSATRFGEQLEGLVVDADADVQLRNDGSAEIRSSRGCDSVLQQFLAGDGRLLGEFEPVAVDFGELGSGTLPGGFTMQIDSRLVYVTLQEPVEYEGCDAVAIPGLAMEQPLPSELGATGALAWSVTWSCTELTPGVRSVKSHLLAEDGSGMSVGFTLGAEGSPNEVSELSAFGGDGPGGFLATYVKAARLILERGAQDGESEDVIPAEVIPQGGRLVPIALPSSGRAEIASAVPPSGTVMAGNFRIPFACAE